MPCAKLGGGQAQAMDYIYRGQEIDIMHSHIEGMTKWRPH